MTALAKGKKWDRVIENGKVVSDAAQTKFDNETPKLTLPFILKDVYVYFLTHKKGGVPKMEPKYKGDNEYPVQILVTEKIWKLLKKYHKKLSYKEYTAAKFEKQFKTPVPASEINEDDNYYVIKFASNAAYKDKTSGDIKLLDPPRVLATDKSSLADTLIGNGSLATIGFEFFTYKHPTFGFGCSVNLKMVRISELVEYVGAADSLDDDEMGFDEEVDELDGDFDEMGDDTPSGPSAEELANKEAAAQAAAQASTPATDDDEIF
ncbi:MAG: hypothetical protein HRT61_00585 [Ekhidna sp.]|nr:hypothetical protein [Ekhidna sp.]